MEFIDAYQNQFRILGHVVLAMALGGVIGLDRELEKKPAGLRTHMLVSGAAALVVLLGNVVVESFDKEMADQLVRADPIRIIEAVITGVSFLGAGTIITHSRSHQVEGLTTAAAILFTAVLGVCVAVSQIVLAVSITAIVFLTLRGVSHFSTWVMRHHESVPPKSEHDE